METEKLEEEQKRLELIHELTTHPGWVPFEEDMKEAYDMQDNVLSLTSEADMRLAQGRMQMLHSLINTKATVRHHLDEIEKKLSGSGESDGISLVDDIEGEGHEQL